MQVYKFLQPSLQFRPLNTSDVPGTISLADKFICAGPTYALGLKTRTVRCGRPSGSSSGGGGSSSRERCYG
jgi:hypothetical protein